MAERLRGSLTDAPDHLLVERSADGDVRAFEVLLRRYASLLTVTARRVLGSSDEVDDVVQETFLTAWKQLPTLENTAQVKSWLVKIVGRKSIDRIRARHDHDDIADHADQLLDALPTPDETAVATSRHEALANALAGLPDDQRRCWVLRELAGYSYDEIARDLDLPVSTVRGTLGRARRNLSREMEGWR